MPLTWDLNAALEATLALLKGTAQRLSHHIPECARGQILTSVQVEVVCHQIRLWIHFRTLGAIILGPRCTTASANPWTMKWNSRPALASGYAGIVTAGFEPEVVPRVLLAAPRANGPPAGSGGPS
ncbi:hypothetical protein [Streptomyces buecherae]|uniref:Uncharacterized protein n=1 Tax=Streptomyces buecherae TaxID=2763006 RepID=A0A7H8N5E7_9ACTN|nr:hypothetical protein [Streptomyces buecherae]QKW49569.1 hypothetical protein HUT08_08360 [Streptomyces buecherae]